jgi:hypothetical protein
VSETAEPNGREQENAKLIHLYPVRPEADARRSLLCFARARPPCSRGLRLVLKRGPQTASASVSAGAPEI